MIRKYLAMLVMICSPLAVNADNQIELLEEPSVIGEWKFTAYILDEKTYPLPNPNLDLRFHFDTNLVARLFWSRSDEIGFCERKANYLVHDHSIYQKVFWTNPLNRADCAQDPDMQIGKESYSHFDKKENRLLIDFPLSDKTLTFILEKVD